jgi:hypothetical protein
VALSVRGMLRRSFGKCLREKISTIFLKHALNSGHLAERPGVEYVPM